MINIALRLYLKYPGVVENVITINTLQGVDSNHEKLVISYCKLFPKLKKVDFVCASTVKNARSIIGHKLDQIYLFGSR